MKRILDACCGPRGMWFNKGNKDVLYLDKRCQVYENEYPSGFKKTEIKPDIIGDFTALPFEDETFHLVVFDPPHIVSEKKDNSEIKRRYGWLEGEWKQELQKGFEECFRVLKPNGILIFKWAELGTGIKEMTDLSPIPPLFGHVTSRNMKTHWVTFMK